MNTQTDPLLHALNEAQLQAVTAPDTHMLVLAGAGSGKTRVLIHRMAWLNQRRQVPLSDILAVTFTNKAAGEIKRRLEKMGMAPRQMWVGTFHGLAHRWLRAHSAQAHLPDAFQVMDSEDQLRMIKRVLVDLELDKEVYPPRELARWINGNKDEGLRPSQITPQTIEEQTYLSVYAEYETRCQVAGLVDFGELLLRTRDLFTTHPDILELYQKRFSHLLVDEFQDTNTLQYELVRQLAGKTGVVTIVGDDSQSIYGWRGARMENMQKFLKEYTGAQLIRLEQNYRSFPAVLEAANAVIACNTSALKKKLWTAQTSKELIAVYTALDERDEAQHVVEKIQRWVKEGGHYDDCAVLYRSNALSRPVEEALLAARIPYRITGGLRFFERAEIKDAMAYLRLASSERDDASFERIANVPARGLGQKTLEQIRARARQGRCSGLAAARGLLKEGKLAKRAQTAVEHLVHTMDEICAGLPGKPISGMVKHMLEITGLKLHHGKEGKNEADRNRMDNLDELVDVAGRFSPMEGAPDDPLLAFLTHAALEAGEAAAGNTGPAVELMTLHAAKGLEFPCVFIIGLEQGLFPSEQSLEDPDPGRLEEERRLAYVGLTRAEQRLTLSHARQRHRFGALLSNPVSEFITAIPRHLLKLSNQQTSAALPGAPIRSPNPPQMAPRVLAPGARVNHVRFGTGVIIKVTGNKAMVAFKVGARQVEVCDLSR